MMISHTTHTWPVNHTQCNSNCKCSQNHCSLLHAFQIVTVSPFITTTFLYLYFVSQQNCNYGLIRSLLHNVQLLYMNLSVVVWVCIYTSNVFTCSQRRRSNKGGRCACRVILQQQLQVNGLLHPNVPGQHTVVHDSHFQICQHKNCFRPAATNNVKLFIYS